MDEARQASNPAIRVDEARQASNPAIHVDEARQASNPAIGVDEVRQASNPAIHVDDPMRQSGTHPVIAADLDAAHAADAPAPTSTDATTADADADAPRSTRTSEPPSSRAEPLPRRPARSLPPPTSARIEPPAVTPSTHELQTMVDPPRWPAILTAMGAIVVLTLVIVRSGPAPKRTAPVPDPAGQVAPVDAGMTAVAPDAPGEPAIDAAEALVPDAAEALVPDAAEALVPDAAPTTDAEPAADADPAEDYKKPLATAARAIEDGDYERALAQVEQSLATKRSARGFVVRADALRRLGRIAPALESADEAIRLNSRYAPAWEMKGKILWSARRYDEARPVYERFLALQPTGESANTVRALLGIR